MISFWFDGKFVSIVESRVVFLVLVFLVIKKVNFWFKIVLIICWYFGVIDFLVI